MLDNFIIWFIGTDYIFMLGRFALIALVWWLGIRLNRKKGSALTWGITWAWGLFCIALTILIMCRCEHIGLGGFVPLGVFLASIFVIGIYIEMLGATVFYTFYKEDFPQSERAVTGS